MVEVAVVEMTDLVTVVVVDLVVVAVARDLETTLEVDLVVGAGSEELQVIVEVHQGAVEVLVHQGGEDLIKALGIKKDLVIHKEDLEIQVDPTKVLETMQGPQKGLAIQVVRKKGLEILMDL